MCNITEFNNTYITLGIYQPVSVFKQVKSKHVCCALTQKTNTETNTKMNYCIKIANQTCRWMDKSRQRLIGSFKSSRYQFGKLNFNTWRCIFSNHFHSPHSQSVPPTYLSLICCQTLIPSVLALPGIWKLVEVI